IHSAQARGQGHRPARVRRRSRKDEPEPGGREGIGIDRVAIHALRGHEPRPAAELVEGGRSKTRRRAVSRVHPAIPTARNRNSDREFWSAYAADPPERPPPDPPS